MGRLTLKKLVCEEPPSGLGYCCVYAFFRMFKQTGKIAERLGVETRTVRYHKVAFKDGKTVCQKAEKCLKGRLF